MKPKYDLIAVVLWEDWDLQVSELIEYNFTTGVMHNQFIEKRDLTLSHDIHYQNHSFNRPEDVANVNNGENATVLDVFLRESGL